MLDYDIKPFVISDMFKISKFYTMYATQSPPGSSFLGESHDFWECTYIKEGKIRNCVAGKVYDAEEGDLVFYKPLEFHQFHSDEVSGAEMFCFTFSFENCPPDFATDTVYKLDTHQRQLIERLVDYVENAIKNNPFTEEEIALQKSEYITYKYVRSLLAFSKNPIDMAAALNCIYELFISLCGSKNVVAEADSYQSGIYRNAVHFMTEHISKKISVSDIANHCHVSETSLKKIFYQFAHTSVHKHFVQLKIAQAIILLKSGVSASETSERIGFANQTHLTSVFKRELGLTPREYLMKHSD